MVESSEALRSCALAQVWGVFLHGSLLLAVNLHFWETECFLARFARIVRVCTERTRYAETV